MSELAGYIRIYTNGKTGHYKRFTVVAIALDGKVTYQEIVRQARKAYFISGQLSVKFPKMKAEYNKHYPKELIPEHQRKARTDHANQN